MLFYIDLKIVNWKS